MKLFKLKIGSCDMSLYELLENIYDWVNISETLRARWGL